MGVLLQDAHENCFAAKLERSDGNLNRKYFLGQGDWPRTSIAPDRRQLPTLFVVAEISLRISRFDEE